MNNGNFKKIKEDEYQSVSVVEDDDTDGIIIHYGYKDNEKFQWPHARWDHIPLTLEQAKMLNKWLHKYIRKSGGE
jgi:hypothetical protein